MAKISSIGQMDRYITLKTATETQNDSGETVLSYTDLDDVHAYRRQTGAKETTEGGQLQDVDNVDWIIWYRSDFLSTKNRIEDEDGDVYEIKAIYEIGRKHKLKLSTIKV